MANNRGMGTVSWGQRKALRGIPYGTDPAYLLAQQQMQEEYNLMPERARLAEEKRQRDKAQEEANKNRKAQGMAGITSAGTSILTADALRGFQGTRGLVGMGKEGVNYLTGATSMPYAEGQAIADAGGTIATSTPTLGMAGAETAIPAIGDAGSLAGVTAESLGGTSVAGQMAGETAATGAGQGMGLAAGGIAAGAAAAVKAGHELGTKMGGSEGLSVGTPFSLPTAPQSMLADKALGDSNYITNQMQAMQWQEKSFYDGLDSLLSGNIEGWASETANAVLKPITKILGIDDIF